MKATVYIETSVIGYLTTWPREDIVVAAHQQTTRDWWATAASRFELLVSQLVVQECAAGDPSAAKERLEALSGIKLVPTSQQAEELARQLVAGNAVSAKYPEDALHIALAAAHGIEYLVTWNFRHIANAAMRSAIEQICRDHGYEPPIICSPEELLEL